MGCACKQARKIASMSAKDYSHKSKASHVTKSIFNFFINLLNKIIVLVLFVIAIPIVIIGIIFNYLFKGKLYFKLPRKMMKPIKEEDFDKPISDIKIINKIA